MRPDPTPPTGQPWRRPWRTASASATVLLASLALGAGARDAAPVLDCDGEAVTSADLEQALQLGIRFMLRSQLPAGNFRYEYDWETKKESQDDNSVRQAGALWVTAQLHREFPSEELGAAVRKGLEYFASKSKVVRGGHRIVCYPGEKKGKLGTLALLVLAHVDFLKQDVGVPKDSALRKKLEGHLKGYLRQLLDSENQKTHLFRGLYRLTDGKPLQKNSPYYNGESLLGLVRAAQYVGGKLADRIWERVPRMAHAGANEVKRAMSQSDWKWLKGYYQWSAMAWHELLRTGEPRFQEYTNHMLPYADYMLKKHGYGAAQKAENNLGVVLEGLVPAVLAARARNDSAHTSRLGCFALQGLQGMLRMQVGHGRAAGLAGGDLPRELAGGFQGNVASPKLRIDTTQHSLHAILEARDVVRDLAAPSPAAGGNATALAEAETRAEELLALWARHANGNSSEAGEDTAKQLRAAERQVASAPPAHGGRRRRRATVLPAAQRETGPAWPRGRAAARAAL